METSVHPVIRIRPCPACGGEGEGYTMRAGSVRTVRCRVCSGMQVVREVRDADGKYSYTPYRP